MNRYTTIVMLAWTVGASGCSKEESKPLAAKQELIERTQPKTPDTLTLEIDSTTANVRFEMEAPLERQDGEVPPSAVSGSIDIQLSDLSKSAALINVDISELVIYQQAAEEAGQYGEREKSELQNEHMRDWLEIGDDAPPEEAEKNRLVQFSLTGVEDVSDPDVTSMTGSERIVNMVAVGDVRLHQRVSTKRVPLRMRFGFDGDRLDTVAVETVEPLLIDLAEHDVRPRTGFGKLAEKTLSAMSPKVGKEARVEIEFKAKRTD